jgi:hypothetical protein
MAQRNSRSPESIDMNDRTNKSKKKEQNGKKAMQLSGAICGSL